MSPAVSVKRQLWVGPAHFSANVQQAIISRFSTSRFCAVSLIEKNESADNLPNNRNLDYFGQVGNIWVRF